MFSLDQQLRLELQAREAVDLGRHLRVVPKGALDLASNDYLGLARHPQVVEAACEATREFGVGARSSRLVSGHGALHETLEAELADFKGCEAALLFPSGYAANLSVISALARRGAIVLCDKRNHASLIDGCRLAQSQGALVRYYGSTIKLRALLGHMSTHAAASSYDDARRVLIVSDAVYSMDGDLADVPLLCDLAREFGATILLDDAHGTGTLGQTGRGTLEHFSHHPSDDISNWTRQENQAPREPVTAGMSTHARDTVAAPGTSIASAGIDARVENIIQIGTLSKALGGQGGFVAGSRALIDWLVNAARPFIYTTALAPPLCAAALESLRIVIREPQRVARLQQNGRKLARALSELGFDVPHRDAPILPVVAGSARRALDWSEQLARCGVWCPSIRPPTVPQNTSRLRLTVSSALDDEDIARIAQAFQDLKLSSRS